MNMKTKSKAKWIQGAVKTPGQLHRDLGVPQGEPIPAGKLAEAAKEGGKLGQRARFAEAAKGFKHPKAKKESRGDTVSPKLKIEQKRW